MGRAVALGMMMAGVMPVHAACIRPVQGSAPVNAIEREQPYRLATNPVVVPGYDRLIVQAGNRYDTHPTLYRIEGDRFLPLDRALPGAPHYDAVDPVPLRDGSTGFIEVTPPILWHLPGDGSGWRTLPWARDFAWAVHDAGTGVVTVATRDGRVWDWDGTSRTPADPSPPLAPMSDRGRVTDLRTLPAGLGRLATTYDGGNGTILWHRTHPGTA
ncbi:hypothetical protein [Jannaschia sp. LMIT008]|uniref:hypothetical protein n=1 Tax=Jannaschia maritima TaxID=3032585 RepID=UPI002810AC8B|nr:hypothetical protein [Jannaschia sp. LMIT008]